MGKLSDEFAKLKEAVTVGEADLAKAEGGNRSAGTRVRKAMQDVKNAAQEIRKAALESTKSE